MEFTGFKNDKFQFGISLKYVKKIISSLENELETLRKNRREVKKSINCFSEILKNEKYGEDTPFVDKKAVEYLKISNKTKLKNINKEIEMVTKILDELYITLEK